MSDAPMLRLAPPPEPYAPWAASLHSVGVTGTNGKTSTTLFIAEILRETGLPVGSETTLGLGGRSGESDRPLHGTFFERMQAFAESGVRHLALEVTSEALAQGWAKRWRFDSGVFTNLSRDHLNAHGSFEHYLASKAQLFVHLAPGGVAVLNAADPACVWLDRVTPNDVRRWFFASSSRGEPQFPTQLAARSVQVHPHGTTATLAPSELAEAFGGRLEIGLFGAVFVENALAAALATWALGVEPSRISRGLRALAHIPGRFQVVSQSPFVAVDYAHTEDALARTLDTGREILQQRAGARLIVVFGAGGDRDRDKREPMGEAVGRRADCVVLTSDNPRNEDPAQIASALKRGCDRGARASVLVELDRARAIELALNEAGPRDVVLICGKGHERTQQIGSTISPFDDAECVRAHTRRSDATRA